MNRIHCTVTVTLTLLVFPVDAQHDANAPLPGKVAAKTMKVPEGVRVTLFADEPDVMQPIGFCVDHRGRIWVAEAYNYPNHGNKPGDRIVILEDVDGDGHFDKRKVFYEGLNYVSGIEVGFGGAWVMSPPSMYFIPDKNDDDVPDEEPTVLLDGFGNHANAHNMANGFAWGPDGWLYATHGRTNWSMIGKPGAKERQRERFDGGVWRYHPVRHVWEPYADGTTNPWGIDWNDYGDAFICNCVNPHLFQVIQGAHYEPWRNRDSSKYAYQRIDTIADHLHFTGLGNVRNGLGSDAEDVAGGGHAHCGTMIYLGDAFPSSYRNQLFTNNIHGRRMNNDLLRRVGSGYVASHGPDLMISNDPWFMGVSIAQGPNGEIYVSDWSDTGECHSTRNTRRHTGRIYRLTYLSTKLTPVDLRQRSNEELAEMQASKNEWLVRHARRLLYERHWRGDDLKDVHHQLGILLHNHSDTAVRLRALWALWVTEGTDENDLFELLSDHSPELRRWAVTLLCEDRKPSNRVLSALSQLAAHDDSPRVRLSLASALQRLPLDQRWELAGQLASHSEDATDQNLPLMYWYGIEPLVNSNLERFVGLAASASLSRLRINMSRRIADSDHRDHGFQLLCKALVSAQDPSLADDLISGLLHGLEGQSRVRIPDAWPDAYQNLKRLARDNSSLDQKRIELALKCDDETAISSLQRLANDSSQSAQRRQRAIRALADRRHPDFDDDLIRLVSDADVRRSALRGLANYQQKETASVILSHFAAFTADEKQQAIATLSSRVSWASELLDSLASTDIAKSEVSAFAARQISQLDDDSLTKRLQEVWGRVRETPRERSRKIASLRKWLNPDVVASADLERGEKLFDKSCASCHRFFGDGGKIGPDITGAQRENLDYLLENIVAPNASVSHDYRMHRFLTRSGRVITGLVETEDRRRVVVVTATDRVILQNDEIEQRDLSEKSIMPEGLLDNLSESEIRDLIGFLQRTE